MTPEQHDLLAQAMSSLEASRLLLREGFHGFAAARAYYTMFYVAEAFLLGKELAFSRHVAVHRGFGEHFVKDGSVRREFLTYLNDGMAVRHAGDYRKGRPVTREQAEEQIAHAGQFLDLARKMIGDF